MRRKRPLRVFLPPHLLISSSPQRSSGLELERGDEQLLPVAAGEEVVEQDLQTRPGPLFAEIECPVDAHRQFLLEVDLDVTTVWPRQPDGDLLIAALIDEDLVCPWIDAAVERRGLDAMRPAAGAVDEPRRDLPR